MANKFHVKGLKVKYAKDRDYDFLLDPALFNQKENAVADEKHKDVGEDEDNLIKENNAD